MATEEVEMSGWNAITDAFLKLYPGQTDPLHFGTLISWRLGGDCPLDGVSVYDGGEYYHLVSYGLSELYEKESENKEYSGYGFEFTMKLKKSSLKDENNELKCAVGILQSLATETYTRGEIFSPYEYVYTGQAHGIDVEGISKLTGFVTVLDEAGEIDTPNGKVQFVQLVGMTDDELQQIMQKKKTVQELITELGHTMTDYQRDSME